MAKKITTSTLLKMKQQGEKISTITAYDASFAKLFDQAGIHAILIGDSLGMVLQGQDDTLPVTIDDMAYHTRSVRAGVENTLIIGDMPFMTYATTEMAYVNATKLMQAGASMVKMEGGSWLTETIKALVERGIPVCGHLGLTPQSVNVFGGFKVQGREACQAQTMIEEAKALEAAGVQLLVLECIPADLGAAITDAVTIPTIGIGAGKDTDGQILVMHDALGISCSYMPKFSRNFLQDTGDIKKAVELYISEVSAGNFPGEEHIFK
ncbi:3-methyl-2-oxobutanoate hydroxymethyltransferase [Thalassotalea eurytherma]|uniref:3-methyl-2-oxobutanoate hydroxymethyltransferase n=1 Tax=Thalassotalea eurytherma TaxID=1144278 RepID=A0ABQ6H601_9GAMM|nr:3-methyl-2-oxobutanoate hydroxymethyltransferase [Thalassotalea eurytherma]GLX82909.1 3-methyl-2-oxobutanoate hydroxymethyltransferase [Thalassotalea eurytherma]